MAVSALSTPRSPARGSLPRLAASRAVLAVQHNGRSLATVLPQCLNQLQHSQGAGAGAAFSIWFTALVVAPRWAVTGDHATAVARARCGPSGAAHRQRLSVALYRGAALCNNRDHDTVNR